MRLLLKNTFKKIGKSIGRFLSIMLIIALGISVFMGLRESTAGMLYTVDNYYDKNNLMDFKITSTYGLTNDDIESINNLKNVDKVIPSYSIDVINDGDSIRVHSIEKDINSVILIDGRMPKNNNECLGDYYKFEINKTITFESDNLKEVLSIKSCKVVGLIKSPLYIRSEKGISSVGNGKLISFIYVNKDVFISKYYTEIYITSSGSKEKNSYYSDYNKSILSLKKELEELKPIRETIRYEEILKEANDEIIKNKNEIDNKINKSLKKLESAKKDLDAGKKELENTREQNIEKFESNRTELNNNKNIILSSLSSQGISINDLDNYILNLSNSIKNIKSQLSLLDTDSEEYISLSNQLSGLETDLNNLNSMKTNLESIDKGLIELEANYAIFLDKISNEEKRLNTGYSEYEKGLAELEKSKKEANKKIEEAKEKLKDIEKPIWYLLDRTDNSGYISYKEDIIKVDAIAKILPIFFILVVILMTLNTLTRLIEEERNEMGILESNGFSKANILFSYLVYVLIAGLSGIGIGLTIGYSIIPKIIYGVFLSRYYVPKLITIVSPLPFSLVIIVTIVIMVGVTIIACMRELKETPASLLRPKAPKTGKKTIIEKVDFIWSKLSFMWKTTIRNILRYKKRIVMTVLGVAGCTALLVAGLGINDSVNTISKLQYDDIIKYDSMYILKDNVDSISNKLNKFFEDNGVVNPLLINQNAYTYTFDNKTEDVYLVVPSDITNFNNYVSLTSTITNKKISIPNYGAVITKQMADSLKLSVGDSINIRNSNNELYILYVSDIVYNYVSHYIYISKEYYKEIFNEEINYNSIIANGQISNSIKLNDYNILTINSTDDIVKTFDSFVDGLNQIIIMIVVFACFLAFIVLYNLTIINVSERKREIATFKVLGFYDKEILVFVYRETIILTIIGILFGLLGGVFLHQYIITTAQTDNIMFLRKISIYSYLIASIVTIIFSLIVQLIINRTLKKIDMIDSLKSVE